MAKMALLLSTDDWDKLPVQQRFADDHGLSVWRTRGRYNTFLEDIPYPVNLYFFHASVICYRARCTRIDRVSRTETGYTLTSYDNASSPTTPPAGLVSARHYRLEDVPDAFRSDPVAYTLFYEIDKLAETPATHISRFPKWQKPGEFYDRGQLGLFKVVDVFAE